MLLHLILLASVFATAVLSGVLGMAGGIILMAILVTALPVATAMVLHGAVQAFSNGSRAWFLRRHIQWRVLPPYLLGAAGAVAGFLVLAVTPDPAVVLILIGAMPWAARLAPRMGDLDMRRPATAAACGLLVTATQLLAGASGPLLDMFYVKSPLDRYQVVASKAITQTVGHLLKLLYYGVLIGAADALPVWLYGAAILAAVVGARVGTRLLDRVADSLFRRVSGGVILAIGAACMIEGIHSLVGWP